MRVDLRKPLPEDIQDVGLQLGIKEPVLKKIAFRCKHSFPVVVILDPFVKDDLNFTALANPIWLTCPHLNEKIHDLESKGLIPKMKEIINQNKSYIDSMKKAHAEYALLRLKICNEKLKDSDSFNSSFKTLNTGIGGIKDTGQVKCLHLHYAHSLICRHNVIGNIVSKFLDDTSCSQINCRNLKTSQYEMDL